MQHATSYYQKKKIKHIYLNNSVISYGMLLQPHFHSVYFLLEETFISYWLLFFFIYEILMDFNNLSDKNTSPIYLAVA